MLTKMIRNGRFGASIIVLVLAGFSLSFIGQIPITSAIKPSDAGLREGDVISAWQNAGDPDVYIINDFGFKRLFLNPVIFGFYGHLGSYASVKNVDIATRDSFVTSGLFRNCEINDPKVYALDVTGEDTGVLSWVNVAGNQAATDDTNFFRKVFCVNSKEFNWYPKGANYTAISQIPVYSFGGSFTPPISPTPTPTSTPKLTSVVLSPVSPANQTITLNAQGLEIMTLRFSGQDTLQSLKFKRLGAGSTSDYDNLYVYDGSIRLTNGRIPSSSDGTITFTNLKTGINGTKDISLVADHSGTVGNVNNWSLVDAVLSSGTIKGLPVISNHTTFSGVSSGIVNISKNGSLSNPKVGQKNALVSEFKITANTEDAHIKRVRLFNAGSIKPSDITNPRLEINNTTISMGTMTSDGSMVFGMENPGFRIAKGDSRIIKVFADIAGRKDETIKFYVEQQSDILAIGGQFGFGMKSQINSNFDNAVNTHALTLQGGIITITFNGPSASTIVDKSQDVPILRYSLSAEKDVELRRHQIILCVDKDGNGTFDNASGNFGDLDDIKIKNEDSGVILSGPVDGISFTTTNTACPLGATGLVKEFVDTIDVQAGKTLNLVITADVNTSNSSDSSTALTNDSIIRAIVRGYGDMVGTSGNISIARYSGTNTAIASSHFVPSSNISGNDMTIGLSSLSLALAGSPSSNTYTTGAKNIDAVGFILQTALGSEVSIKSIKLSAYISDDNITFAKSLGLASPNNNLTVQNLISAIRLYDGNSGQLISDSPSFNNLNNSSSNITFNNLDWIIPSGSSKRLLVRVDASNNPPSGLFDGIAFDIAQTDDITGVDSFGTTVNVKNASVNNGTSPIVKMKISTGGSITASVSPNTPSTEAKYWGQSNAEFSRFRLTSSNEAQLIERLIFTTNDSTSDLVDNVKNISVTYTNKAGQILTSTNVLNANGSASFTFSGDIRPYVPRDSSIDIIVAANLKTRSEGATSNKTFSIDLSNTFNGSATNGFRAVGEGSGKILTGSDIGSVLGENMIVYRVFPKFDQIAVTTGEPIGTKEAMKFTITAMGLPDSKLLFDGPASGSIKFEVIASGGLNSNVTARLYDSNNVLYGSSTISNAQAMSPNASLSIDFSNKDLEISGGTTKTFRIEIDFTNFTHKSDYFQLILRDDENGLIKWVDNSTGSNTDQMIQSLSGVLRILPLNGPIFNKL